MMMMMMMMMGEGEGEGEEEEEEEDYGEDARHERSVVEGLPKLDVLNATDREAQDFEPLRAEVGWRCKVPDVGWRGRRCVPHLHLASMWAYACVCAL